MPARIFVCSYALRRISPKNSHLSCFPPTLMMVSVCELDYQFPNHAEVFSCDVQGYVYVFTLHTSLHHLMVAAVKSSVTFISMRSSLFVSIRSSDNPGYPPALLTVPSSSSMKNSQSKSSTLFRNLTVWGLPLALSSADINNQNPLVSAIVKFLPLV